MNIERKTAKILMSIADLIPSHFDRQVIRNNSDYNIRALLLLNLMVTVSIKPNTSTNIYYTIQIIFLLYRGRYAVVHKCVQKCSGQDVAAKCISRRLSSKESVETEFNTLQSLQNAHLAHVFDLYETPANLVIVMQV